MGTRIDHCYSGRVADERLFHHFDEDDAPEVLTSISEECQRGDCVRCPGIFHHEEAGEERVFCIHECHRVRAAS